MSQAPLPGDGGLSYTCDWGGCDEVTAAVRWDPQLRTWLGVCDGHANWSSVELIQEPGEEPYRLRTGPDSIPLDPEDVEDLLAGHPLHYVLDAEQERDMFGIMAGEVRLGRERHLQVPDTMHDVDTCRACAALRGAIQ